MDQNSDLKNNSIRSELCITTWPPLSVELYMDSSLLWSKKMLVNNFTTLPLSVYQPDFEI